MGHAVPTPTSGARIAARFAAGAKIASAAAVAIGALVIAGWFLHIPVLIRLHPALASMKLNTALAIALLGAAFLRAIDHPRSRLSRAMAIAAMAIAAATLIEAAAGIDLGIDQLLLHDLPDSAAHGRMSPWTAACVLVLGGCALDVASPWAGRAGLAVALCAHVAVLGHLYGVHDLYAVGVYSSVALHTAFAIYALAVATLLAPARPRGVMRLIASDSPGGVLARRLVPPVLVIPAVLALLRQWGEQIGLFGPGFGRAIHVSSNTVVLIALIWWTAAALIRADELRRTAEVVLRDSEARKAAILASAMDAILTVDSAGIIREANPAAEAMFGRGRDSAIGIPLVDWLAPGPGRDAVAHLLASVEPSVLGARVELAAIRAGAGEFPVEVSITRIGAAEPARFTVFVRDMTDAHRARADLVRSRDRLRALAQLSDAYAAVATSYQPLLEQIARTVADIVGDGCIVALISDDGEQLATAAHAHRDPAHEPAFRTHVATLSVALHTSTSVSATVARTGQPTRAEADPASVAAQADEALRPLFSQLDVHALAVVPIRARDTVIGTLSVLRNAPGRSYSDEDVTLLSDLADRAGLAIENARLYAQLEQRVHERTAELEAANQELESFSYSVAHDLRAPLRAISGFSHALLDDGAERMTAEDLRFATQIRDAAHRMSDLIDALLDLARISRIEPRRRRVDVSALAHRLVAALRPGHPERDVEVAIADDLVTHADPRLLEIALTNLLDNAWKFTAGRDNARIELGVLPGDRPPVFFVRDNGAGFDPSQASKLFGVFQRLHTAQDFEGTGIGLATVHRIIRRHGGVIWAEAELDRGATFYFTLQPPPRTR